MLFKKWFKHFAITISILTPCVLALILLRFITVIDPSIQPVYKAADAEVENTPIHLISYAANKDVFFKNQNILSASAVNRGIDSIRTYKRRDIDTAFYTKNKAILDDSYGAGWWLWKPYFILKTLEALPEGDIVFYADTGLLLRGPIKDYIADFMKQTEKNVLLFVYDPDEYGLVGKCASRETFIKLGCDTEEYRQGPHVWAGIVIVRNSAQGRAFIKSWLSYCEDADLLQGKNLKAPPNPEFTNHQHDEAILSVLAHREHPHVMFDHVDRTFFDFIHMHRRKADDEQNSLLTHISLNITKREFDVVDFILKKFYLYTRYFFA